MMGSPIYYYVPSDTAIGDLFHDCMWSGVCACCQEADLGATTTVVVKSSPSSSSSCASSASSATSLMSSMTAMSSMELNEPKMFIQEPRSFMNQNPQQTIHQVQVQQQQQQKALNVNAKNCLNTVGSHHAMALMGTQAAAVTAVPANSTRATVVKREKSKEIPSKLTHTKKNSISTKHPNSTSSSPSSSTPHSDYSLAAKKLRHREVEKNRHRQLQAMVRTLSERIPGFVDKETQVQTMRRAARYCVFLRDVLAAVAHGQVPMNRERLEKIYLRSCDNVELIMSQQC